ncbi:hypothetical protein ACGF07_29565 [Kitasatospora sp. NPDC048194]|uniref:hypothetical protein n=1 Tax=Kitasatospora sp. NPDC048194 TaxID=3364045 RepID=UPI0037108294
MDGIPPERTVTDSWPALHGRPVLRRTVAVGLVLGVSVAAALVVRGVNALTEGQGGRETDRDRAERLAGLHASQHPGAGRYYIPVSTVYTRTPSGAPVAYLHYRLGGGKDPGVGEFLQTYDLPAPGPTAPLPPDLVAALGGDEPAEAPELPEVPTAPAPGVPSAGASSPGTGPEPAPAPAPVAAAAADPGADAAAGAAPGSEGGSAAGSEAGADPDPDSDGDAGSAAASAGTAAGAGAGDPTPAPTPAPTTPSRTPDPTPAWTATPTPGWSPSAVAVHPPGARRIYVVAVPGGLPGAADIYVRATG